MSLNEKRRSEITELMDTLRGNLDKVVQHGKRADAIVKNMLLHSREGSGKHRPVDINAIVEESLNLAYHGARAEKQGFNITLQRSFDPTAGEADVFPQDITRVLLIGNSDGDRQMLEYTGAGDGARLMMLVLHDDAKREYAYGPAQGLPASKVGTFTQALYDEAKKKGWTLISMKGDWKRIFAFD